MDRRLALLCAAFALLLACSAVRAQGDGPRNYQLMPDGAKSLTAFGIFARGNQSADSATILAGSEIDATLAVLQYTQAFSLAGKQVQLFGQPPFGEAKGTFRHPGGTVSASSSGIGDASIGVLLGLAGSPALSAKEYVQYQPGFTLGAMGKIFMPTGSYDSSKPVNLGANRWAFQAGAPIIQYLGRSFLDPSLTSFELTPSVTFFTNNNDPHDANTRQQDPVAKLEGHITRNLGPACWLSADAFYGRGGETITDGVRDNNTQRWLILGGSAGVAFNEALSATLNYSKLARHNLDGLEARSLRFDVVFAF